MNRSGVPRNWRRALSCGLLFAAAQGCGHAADDPAQDDTAASAEKLGTIICGSYPSTDELGTAIRRPEYYRLTSMNRTLQAFPEFASSIGMKSVRSCDDARAFVGAYDDYSEAHPYFDKAMTFDPKVEIPTLPSDPPTVIVPKIFNGSPTGPTTADLFPVVHITGLLPAGAKLFNDAGIPGAGQTTGVVGCSGTFIAKNFILTAAHCFETIALQYPQGTPANQQWITGAKWRIEFPSPSGKVSSTGGGALTLEVFAITIAHPQFSSIIKRDYTPRHGILSNYDLGLLYIPPLNNDGDLPPDVSKSAWDVQLGPVTFNLLSTWTLGDFGYGSTAENGTNLGVLSANFKKPVAIFSADSQIVAPWSGLTGETALCRGDSGGPLARRVANGSGFDTVIIGINSAAGGNNCGAGSDDAGNPLVNTWARVDVVTNAWLRDTLRFFKMGPDWFPNFFADGSEPISYAKMHGSPCRTSCDCSNGEFCDLSISDPSSPYSATRHAQACGGCTQPPIGDCGCQTGQCLPTPMGFDAGSCTH
jgi:hypothetical protein